MDQIQKNELTQRYRAAADSFIEKIKKDVNVIAVIIGGSLAYDQVWEKSDIDATIIVRDQVLKNDNFCIVEDDITINLYVCTRSSFKRFLETIGALVEVPFYIPFMQKEALCILQKKVFTSIMKSLKRWDRMTWRKVYSF